MKKGILIALLAVFLFFLASPAFAGPNEVDAQKSAQVFAGMNLSRCYGGFNFERWGKGEFMEPVYGSFTFMPETKTITYLEVYYEVIVGETMEPLRGLPLNKKGEARYYSIWLGCYDDNSDYQAFGSFFKELMLPENGIVITLQPDWQRLFVPYQPPKGAKVEMVVIIDPKTGDSQTADYCDPKADRYSCKEGGFNLWLNPLGAYTYEIREKGTGEIYATGTIDLLAQNQAVQDPVTPITLQFPGGVAEVKFDTVDYAWEYFTNQGMDGEVEQCVEEPTPTYEQMPMSAVEQILQMGAGRTLYKFRGSAPANADSPMGPLDFSVLAWSNSGGLEFPSVALYAYTDSSYSTPFTKLSPDGMVAPSKTASVGWGIPFNEPGTISIAAAKDGILTIPAGQTLYFDLRVDILGFEAGVGKCAFVVTAMEGLGKAVLYTLEGCTGTSTPSATTSLAAPEEVSGGSGSAHGPAIPSTTTTQSTCTAEIVPAKVYFMDLRGGALRVSVGELDGEIEVRQWVEKGEMPIIALSGTNGWGLSSTSTLAGYERVVVIVTGALRSPDGFYVSFGRSPYSPPRGGGGKG